MSKKKEQNKKYMIILFNKFIIHIMPIFLVF